MKKITIKTLFLLAVFLLTAGLSLTACASDVSVKQEDKDADTAEDFVKDIVNCLFSGDIGLIDFDKYTINPSLENYIRTVAEHDIKTESYSDEKNKFNINSSGYFRFTDFKSEEDKDQDGVYYYVAFTVSSGYGERGRGAQLHIINGEIVNFYIPELFDWPAVYYNQAAGFDIKDYPNPWSIGNSDIIMEQYQAMTA